MTRKTVFTILAMCMFFATTFAQNLQNHIPKDATFVITLNPSLLNSKVKFAKLKEFDFFQMGMSELTKQAGPMASEIKKFINDPAEFGMDMMSSSYLFGKIDGKNFRMGYLLNISDKSKLDELIQTYIAPMVPIEKSNNVQFVAQEGMSLAWTDKQILISGVELEYSEEEEWKAHKERKQMEATAWRNNVLSESGTNSIAMNSRFKLSGASTDDVNLFMDYAAFMKLSQELQGGGGDPMTAMMTEMMSGFYEDAYMSTGLNFDKGEIKINSKYFASDAAMDTYREMSDAPYNKKFLKYIPRENLGMFSYNINLGNIIEMVKKSDNEMLSQYPVYESMAVDALKGMGVDMTADEIYKLWNGDITFVVTGMKDFENEVTSYEFDDDFNKKEVKEMKKERLPEFIMMMSHKNKDGLLKLIDLGKQSSMINEAKGYFQMSVPDMPMDVYMKVDKDMVVISNNMRAVTKKAKKVFKKKNRIKLKDAAQLMNSSMYMVWNIPETMQEMEAMDMKFDGPEGEMFNMGKDSFDSVIINSDKKIGTSSVNSVMKLKFNNKDGNALEQIFSMINDMFMAMGGGSSM